ncbi:PLC-like phosphodiesterase [Poronia punctata]|nr:PLC-like phosphodiesterase [Poronia punctata]
MDSRLEALWLLVVAVAVAGAGALGQITVSDDRTTRTDSTLTLSEVSTPTSLYQAFPSQITLDTGSLRSIPDITDSIATITHNNTAATSPSEERPTKTVTFLTGTVTHGTSSLPGNETTTAVSPTPTADPPPCNNYVEFCTRKYSNITEVACHNSPFVAPNNIAANQEYDVKQQLDDGIRFLQAQIQWPANDTQPHFCHTSCDVLDAGPITDWLTQVKEWVVRHPFDIVTILLGNGNYSVPSMYVTHIERSGILRYVYEPPYVPMNLTSWPTLTEMILSGQRVVMFMDYMANQTEYPWLLDQFSQMWETPFDPTDQSFPCDVQRPPDLARADAENRLSFANHNLNFNLSVLGVDLLVPARTMLNVTNNATGTGSLGASANNCLEKWGRPPNFLNVDYYNAGGFPGSVFEVAAQMNNVTYNRACCGVPASAGTPRPSSSWVVMMFGLGVIAFFWGPVL